MQKQPHDTMYSQSTMSQPNNEFGQPCWFGSTNRPLFGWLHLPSAFSRNAAVVLCPPFGHEYMVAYRSYRKLAAQLAHAGFPVLRFDYDGTGDSAGHAEDSHRISSWQDSIISSVTEIRLTCRVEQVILFGTRLGALLAASVASIANTDTIIMLAPVLSGRLFTRELLAFQGVNIIGPSENNPASTDEIVGYPLKQETKDDLAKIDFTKLSELAIKSALIIPRDDIPSHENRIADALMAEGAAVELKNIAGYRNLMNDDALNSKVPGEIWTFITAWMTKRYPSIYPFPHTYPQGKSASAFLYSGIEICEQVIQFNGITGILTELKSTSKETSKPTIIITNTGANHRVGNHRLCVTMARSWALRGFRVLRFDRPGMGDSVAPIGVEENEIYSSSGLQSLRSMMDYIEERTNINKFRLAGLCSGGYFSYQAALIDRRVVGLLMINPLTYQWRAGDTVLVPHRQIYKATRFYLRTSMRKETWLRLIKGQINLKGIAGTISSRMIQSTTAKWHRAISWSLRRETALSEVARNFLSLESRGTDIFMIFDSAEGGVDLMEEHLGKNASIMKRRKKFRIEFIDNADHTFTPIWAQSHLCNLVGEHWERQFGRQ